MTRQASETFTVRLAETEAQRVAAQRLRYDVFVRELGAQGAQVDHLARLERDRFDPFVDHLILSPRGSEEVVGVYRLMRDETAKAAGGFYSEAEYDLSALRQTGRRLLELGRSCLHPAYRGGTAMHHLWSALADYTQAHGIEILFGVASFRGNDTSELAAPLSLLHHHYLAPPDLRVIARAPGAERMDLIAKDALDRRAAMLQTPSLIKAYLRLGGHVGQGAFIDRDFNTTDVCLILDTANMSAGAQRRYGAGRQ